MAYKVNSFNYGHIRNSIFKNGIATTSKAYGIDKTTLRYIKDNDTFEEYRDYVATKSREQYERRIERQKKRLFGNGFNFDGKITLNNPVPKKAPFESSDELGSAKTIVTDVKEHETPKDLFTPFESKKSKHSTGSKVWPDFTAEMYETAVEMARNGAFKYDIAKRLGYPNVTTYRYYVNKNKVWKEGLARAYEEGKAEYSKNWAKATGVKASKNKSEDNSTTDKPLTPYERGLATGAKKMGMTVEEYKKYKKERMAEGRKNVKNCDNAPKEPEPVEEHTEETFDLDDILDKWESPHTETTVHGKNILLESVGSAIKVVAIGVLVLLLAFSASVIINSVK